MRALSLWQPWATLIAIGAKQIETRHWSTTYRGPVAIHAAKVFTINQRDLCFNSPFSDYLRPAGYRSTSLPFGAYVAVAELVEIVPTDQVINDISEQEYAFGNYNSGRFAWKLANIRRLQPVPARGYQGLWIVDPAVIEQLERAIL